MKKIQDGGYIGAGSPDDIGMLDTTQIFLYLIF